MILRPFQGPVNAQAQGQRSASSSQSPASSRPTPAAAAVPPPSGASGSSQGIITPDLFRQAMSEALQVARRISGNTRDSADSGSSPAPPAQNFEVNTGPRVLHKCLSPLAPQHFYLPPKEKELFFVLKVVCPQYTFRLPNSGNCYFLVFLNGWFFAKCPLFTSVEVNFESYILATSNIFSWRRTSRTWKKHVWRNLYTHFVYLFSSFNFSLTYIIFMSFPSRFLKEMYFISNIFEWKELNRVIVLIYMIT